MVIFRSHKGPASTKVWEITDLFNSLSFGSIIQNLWRAEIILFPFNILILPPSALCHSGSVPDSTRSFFNAASRIFPSPPRTPIVLCHPDKRLVAGDGFHVVIVTNACINLKRGRSEYSEVCRIRKQYLEGEMEEDKHRVFFPRPLCKLLSSDDMYM